jgi:hypothetical protein
MIMSKVGLETLIQHSAHSSSKNEVNSFFQKHQGQSQPGGRETVIFAFLQLNQQ